MEESQETLALNICHVRKLRLIINRLHTLLYSTALLFLFYYRVCFFFFQDQETKRSHFLSWILVFASEILLSFIWILGQAYRWRPVSRTVFPERLPEDEKLPAIDVFICTADPVKEPTVGVMNTVLSAMALDYPPQKLHVYLSDDGGSDLTLLGMKEAWKFARWWLPFCRKYRVKCRCPKAFFSALETDDDFSGSSLFMKEKQKIKEKYEAFVEEINRARENRAPSNDERDQPSLIEEKYEAFVEEINRARENRAPSNDERDQPSLIEVIQDNTSEVEQVELPLLVYVSREKRPSRPHHFKAGALNVLHRVSGVMSNSPYILVLDCDMFCNDPSSARQAMCFHLDSKISPSLAFVQFPQKFHNVSKNDLYDSQMRSLFTIQWQGMDGLNGPVMSGTGFYIKRASLCRKFTDRGTDLMELRQYFGSSNEFIKSLNQNYIPSIMESSGHALLQEARLLASCNYEIGTKWGQEVGFLYDSVVEDYLTGFILHCNGWNSVFCEPSRPQFLGTAATNLNDVLIQGSRWSSGLFENGISKYLPLIYGPPRMSLLQSMCFAELTYYPLYCLPLWCFATIPQLALIHGTPLYPKVSDPYFLVLVFIFVSALTKHLVEVLISGGTVHQWINEERIWMIKSVTCHSYGCLDAVMKKFGIREANFLPTNKVEDDDQTRLYQKDKFDFRASNIFLVPMFALLTLNICCFTVGAYRVVSVGNWDSMLIQLILSTYIIFLNYPVLVGLVFRRDKESISFSVALLFAVLATLVGLAFCELSTLKECVK